MFAFIINSVRRGEVMSPTGGTLKWRSHLERLMEGPERPRPVVTDWGKFVTREATAPQRHHHKFGGFIHKGEE